MELRFKNLIIRAAAVMFTAVLLLGGLSACGGNGKTKIVVMGSTSVQPYAELLAEDYEQSRKVKIDVTGGGSAAGISSAHSGVAQIGMSSRNLKEGEKAGLEEFVIAVDGLAVIINPNNPIIKKTGNSAVNFALEDVRKIYTGEIKDWSELGGNDAKIHIITREDGSGTRTAFEDFVMDKKQISNKATVLSSNGSIRYSVSDDANAIGFISLGLVDEANEIKGQKPVKAVSLDGVAATEENVENGSYKLSRPFLFVTKGEPAGLAKEFIEFVTGARGKEILKNEGLFV